MFKKENKNRKYIECPLCESKNGIKKSSDLHRKNHDYTITLDNGGYGFLTITDHEYNREYIYDVNFCPLCGKKMKKSITPTYG